MTKKTFDCYKSKYLRFTTEAKRVSRSSSVKIEYPNKYSESIRSVVEKG